MSRTLVFSAQIHSVETTICRMGGIVIKKRHFLAPLAASVALVGGATPTVTGELPRTGQLRELLSKYEKFRFYKEKKVGPPGIDSVSVVLLGKRLIASLHPKAVWSTRA